MSFFIKLGEKWQEQRLGIPHYKKGAFYKRELSIVQKIPSCNNLQIREIFCSNIGNMPLTEEEFEFVLHESLPTLRHLGWGHNVFLTCQATVRFRHLYTYRVCRKKYLSEISGFGTVRPFWKNLKYFEPFGSFGSF